MVAKRLTLASEDAVRDAVDELIATFGVIDDAIIKTSGEGFDRRRAPKLKDGDHAGPSGSASVDALWGKKRRSS